LKERYGERTDAPPCDATPTCEAREFRPQSRNPSPATIASFNDIAEQPNIDIFVIAGYIKWFDVSKGFGFIVPDGGLPEILIHVTVLQRDGYQTAYEGARIVCEVLRRDRGLQAFRVIEMDESTATHPSQLPQRTYVLSCQRATGSGP